MTKKRLLVGSLSNDLFRVANLTQRGSMQGSARFAEESKRWARELLNIELPPYLHKIVTEVADSKTDVDLQTAEKYLMYGVLLQNYCLLEK